MLAKQAASGASVAYRRDRPHIHQCCHEGAFVLLLHFEYHREVDR